MAGVSFTDQLTGWAVGGGDPVVCTAGSGFILKTSDGGITWQPQLTGIAVPMNQVRFVDANHGWAVGGCNGPTPPQSGVILYTTNGGTTWLPAPLSPSALVLNGNLLDISFVDATHGWIAGRAGWVLKTTDGVTWSRATLPATVTGTAPSTPIANINFQSLSFVSSSLGGSGWVVGTQGVILFTPDGGTTWSQQNTAGPGRTTQTLRGAAFASASDGWIVGGSSSATGGVILHTTDGGTSWNLQSWPVVLRSVDSVDANHAWSIGDTSGTPAQGTAITTSDGSTWTSPSPTNVTANLLRTDFVDSCHGWAVGLNASTTAYSCALTVTANNISATQGQPFSGMVAAASGGSGPLSATIAWGDGTTDAATLTRNSAGGYDIRGTHTYAAHGTFQLTVTVTDPVGDSATGTAQAFVAGLPFSGGPSRRPLPPQLPFLIVSGMAVSGAALIARHSLRK